MTSHQIKAVDDSLNTIRKMIQNRDRLIKFLVLVLLLTWAFAGYHIFVQMPKMKTKDEAA
jgi:hypothetical protein